LTAQKPDQITGTQPNAHKITRWCIASRRGDVVLTAPNLGTKEWRRFKLGAIMAQKLGKPVRMLNDASIQGLGVITGRGLECVLTMGTGMGFALFEEGRIAPHLELSQHPVRKGKTYDEYVDSVGGLSGLFWFPWEFPASE
jgi:hypothetical protein